MTLIFMPINVAEIGVILNDTTPRLGSKKVVKWSHLCNKT